MKNKLAFIEEGSELDCAKLILEKTPASLRIKEATHAFLTLRDRLRPLALQWLLTTGIILMLSQKMIALVLRYYRQFRLETLGTRHYCYYKQALIQVFAINQVKMLFPI